MTDKPQAEDGCGVSLSLVCRSVVGDGCRAKISIYCPVGSYEPKWCEL